MPQQMIAAGGSRYAAIALGTRDRRAARSEARNDSRLAFAKKESTLCALRARRAHPCGGRRAVHHSEYDTGTGSAMSTFTCESVARAALGEPHHVSAGEAYRTCPNHDDRHPSLKINLNKDMFLCGPCGKGGKAWALAAFLGRLDPDDKPAVSAWLRERGLLDGSTGGNSSHRTALSEKRRVAEFNYSDDLRKVRLEPGENGKSKMFVWEHREGDTWKPGDGGKNKPLYVNQIFRDADQLDYAVGFEGEAKCDLAGELGIPGFSFKDMEESECKKLEGLKIVLWRDKDAVGEKQAQDAAQKIHRCGHPRSIEIITPPAELASGGDIVDAVKTLGYNNALLEELIRTASEWKPVPQPGRGGFMLTKLNDLLNEPAEIVSWLLEGKLPAGGISVLSAKPKVGKSTLARCLALAVATGEPFLDCATTKGPVIYLALEEKRGEVRRHFADLGATGEEEIYIHAASAPQAAVLELCELTKRIRPVLIVIDPLFKFVRIRDEKAYAEVCNAIEPLLTLARESGAHVLLSHHSGKMERADATDSILGSTAIFGGVDTAIILKKADRYRTVQSCQRYGTDWPELVLNFDPTERSLSLGVERSEAEAGRIGEAIAVYLAGSDEPQTRIEIEAHVEGKTKHKRTALKALCAAGRVSESGAGAKGDPLRFALNPSANSQGGNEPKAFVDSCSHVYAGTREQQSQNSAETSINTGDILVPGVSREPQKEADSGEQAFLEGKL